MTNNDVLQIAKCVLAARDEMLEQHMRPNYASYEAAEFMLPILERFGLPSALAGMFTTMDLNWAREVVKAFDK